MSMGIYCYIDKKNNQIVYIGKDSNIHYNKRHKEHYRPSLYHRQQINRVLQNNPNRYTYQILNWDVQDKDVLNALEISYIQRFKPRFNFTKGGDDFGFGRDNPMFNKKPWSAGRTNIFSPETIKKISSAKMWDKNPSSKRNTSGFLNVSKNLDNRFTKGFYWRYRYTTNGKRKSIKSTSLQKLQQKVQKQNLPWKIIDNELAQKSLIIDKEMI